MLNYRNTQLFFLIVLIVLVIIKWWFDLPIYMFIILLVAYLLVTFYGSYFISANFFIRSYNSGDIARKAVALTFDDGPNREYTPTILNILKQYNVPVAFFVIGKNIAGNEDILKRMEAEGHLIGNHSNSHGFWFSMKGRGNMLLDVEQCDATIEKATGKKLKLFRPPYGVTNPTVASVIKDKKYHSVGWSLRSYDTVAKSREGLLLKISSHVKAGDVILLHDHGKYTVAALPDIIKLIREKGLEIVRADELLGLKPYH